MSRWLGPILAASLAAVFFGALTMVRLNECRAARAEAEEQAAFRRTESPRDAWDCTVMRGDRYVVCGIPGSINLDDYIVAHTGRY